MNTNHLDTNLITVVELPIEDEIILTNPFKAVEDMRERFYQGINTAINLLAETKSTQAYNHLTDLIIDNRL